MWPIETTEKYTPSPKMLELFAELQRDDPELADPRNRERFVDLTIQECKESGVKFANEAELRADALAYLESLL